KICNWSNMNPTKIRRITLLELATKEPFEYDLCRFWIVKPGRLQEFSHFCIGAWTLGHEKLHHLSRCAQWRRIAAADPEVIVTIETDFAHQCSQLRVLPNAS